MAAKGFLLLPLFLISVIRYYRSKIQTKIYLPLCQRYMTEDALEVAADSYGGLTDTPYLSPR